MRVGGRFGVLEWRVVGVVGREHVVVCCYDVEVRCLLVGVGIVEFEWGDVDLYGGGCCGGVESW